MVTLTPTKLVGCFMFGIVLVLIGGIVDILYHEILPKRIQEEVTLEKGSKIYDDWVENPVTTYFQVWVFDIQNPEEVIERGDKPFLAERGPYTYREYRQKYNITYHANKTVSYRELQYYVFDEETSVGPESDIITSANVLMMTLADIIKREYSYVTELAEMILDAADDSNLLTKYTVSQLLWGYEDPLLKRVNYILQKFNKTIDIKIGLFYGKNNTDDGLYTVFIEKSKLGEISRWNRLKELPHWTTKTCRMINGTEGRFFHPDVKTKDILYVFASDLYRSFYLDYLGEKQIKNIQLYSFVIPDELFAVSDDNAGFCTPYGHCTPAGLQNISLFKQNAPIYMSQPHFYAGDPDIINSVIGLHPTPIIHQTILDVEPMTGIVMNINKRLQINIYLQNVTNIRDSARFTDGLYLPMAWVNESAGLDDKSAKKFKSEILHPLKLAEGLEYAFIITGCLLSGCVFLFSFKTCLFNNIKGSFTSDLHGEDSNENSKLISPEKKISFNSKRKEQKPKVIFKDEDNNK
ncbi:lysosome membrane protein 2-like [Mytilus galloprovincialis]|uniref:lysosome membrane protein 2-like n=1 Tax=Mytilus galloprovincialis TaxID=29158 RepID=UPI003F7B7525